MERNVSLGTAAVLAVLTAAVFRGPAQGDVPSDATRTAQRPTGSTGSTGETSSHRRRSADDEQADPLYALAESLGLDISTDGLARTALRRARSLGEPQGVANAARDVQFLWRLLHLLPQDTPGLDAAKHQVTEAASRSGVTLPAAERASPRPTERLLAGYLNPHQPDDFDSLDTVDLKREVLRHEADRHGIRVRFLIATLPDPVDSYTGWQFDPMLDAIAQAVSASGYTLDRFHFPDVDADHDAAEHVAGRGLAHEEKPSLVIFRKHSRSGSERLVLQLVHETPTAGVHVRAFARAVRAAAQWNGSTGSGDPCGASLGSQACVRVLGPTFSGTVDSMARGLEMARRTLRNRSVWIVSGSATATENPDTFSRFGETLDGTDLMYQTTVQPDDVLVAALMRHLVTLGWSGSVAVLYEGNTQYGQQILKQVHGQGTERALARFFPEILQGPFPMNISRLRSTSQSDQPEINRTLGMPSRFRALSMEQIGNPSDQLPPLSPATAASYLELQMSGMLQSLERERVRTVALMATDPRDKLYLAQQLSRFAPNLSIVTAESDSLYAHPDYAPYLQGALVASTYPLHAGNQRWSYGFGGGAERRQFANGSSQGMFNAALALLNYTPDGLPASANGGAPRLVEYGPPDGTCSDTCQPPAWISVVGRNSLWPLHAYVGPASPAGPVFRVRPTGGQPARGLPLTFPPPLFAAFCTAVAAGTGLFWLANGRRARNRVMASAQAHLSVRSRGWWVASGGAIALVVGSVLVARYRIGETLLSGAAGAALALGVFVAAARRPVRPAQTEPATIPGQDASGPDAAATAWHVVLAALIAWGLASLGWYAWLKALAAPAEAVGFVARATSLTSGVSPLVPVALLSAALALWAGTTGRRARTPRAALTDPAVQRLMAHGAPGGIAALSGSWAFLNGPITAVPGRLQLAVVAAAAVTCVAFDPFVRPLVSVEGAWFGRFTASAILALQLLICLSLGQFLFLWWHLRQLLDRLAWHPWVDAYQRVPPALFPPALCPGAPRLIELHAAVAACREHLTSVPPAAPFGGAPPAEWYELDRVYREEMQRAPGTFWSQSSTWPALVSMVAACCGSVEAAGAGAGRAGHARLSFPVAAIPPSPDPHPGPAVTAADLFAMTLAFVLRDALARLWHNLTFITGGTVLVFCSHTLFPFQPHRHLEALAWAYAAILFTAIVTVLFQMKRDAVLSRLASATPADRRTWDGALVLKLAAFLLIPLLTLFAAQFPDLGGVILHWAQPVQKALP